MSKEKYFLETIKRIESRTRYKDDCWLFMGTRLARGYGQIWYYDRMVRIGRLICAWTYNVDLNDSSWVACHELICTNVGCWNPNHLRPDTQYSNVHDQIKSGKFHYGTKNLWGYQRSLK